jgi:T-complex protein 1 subunit delta
MDRILREERLYIAKMVKKIAATGCNVLLIQKSILRDAVNDLALDFCAKAKIMVLRDIERDDVEWICKMTGCEPASHIQHFTKECLGECEEVYNENLGTGMGAVCRFTGLKTVSKCVSILLRGSNDLILGETDRSLHDALCVVRSIVKVPRMIAGGGAPEMELAYRLSEWARGLKGLDQICIRRFAEALEVIPYTLSENAGLSPIKMVTQLRHAHANGEKFAGINVRKGTITNMHDEQVVQPVLVSMSSIRMATETVRMILKIDDLVMVR